MTDMRVLLSTCTRIRTTEVLSGNAQKQSPLQSSSILALVQQLSRDFQQQFDVKFEYEIIGCCRWLVCLISADIYSMVFCRWTPVIRESRPMPPRCWRVYCVDSSPIMTRSPSLFTKTRSRCWSGSLAPASIPSSRHNPIHVYWYKYICNFVDVFDFNTLCHIVSCAQGSRFVSPLHILLINFGFIVFFEKVNRCKTWPAENIGMWLTY